MPLFHFCLIGRLCSMTGKKEAKRLERWRKIAKESSRARVTAIESRSWQHRSHRNNYWPLLRGMIWYAIVMKRKRTPAA